MYIGTNLLLFFQLLGIPSCVSTFIVSVRWSILCLANTHTASIGWPYGRHDLFRPIFTSCLRTSSSGYSCKKRFTSCSFAGSFSTWSGGWKYAFRVTLSLSLRSLLACIFCWTFFGIFYTTLQMLTLLQRRLISLFPCALPHRPTVVGLIRYLFVRAVLRHSTTSIIDHDTLIFRCFSGDFLCSKLDTIGGLLIQLKLLVIITGRYTDA